MSWLPTPRRRNTRPGDSTLSHFLFFFHLLQLFGISPLCSKTKPAPPVTNAPNERAANRSSEMRPHIFYSILFINKNFYFLLKGGWRILAHFPRLSTVYLDLFTFAKIWIQARSLRICSMHQDPHLCNEKQALQATTGLRICIH